MRVVSGTALTAGDLQNRRRAPCRSPIAAPKFRMDNALVWASEKHIAEGDGEDMMFEKGMTAIRGSVFRLAYCGPMLVLLVAMLVWWGRSLSGSRDIPTFALDLGEVSQQRDHRFLLDITNTTMHPLFISRLQSSCGCITVAPTNLTVPANSTKSVRLTFDFADVNGPISHFAATLTAYRQEDIVEVPHCRWNLAAKIRSAYTVSPKTLNLGGAKCLQEAMPGCAHLVEIECHEPIEDLFAFSSPNWLAVQTLVGDVKGHYRLEVTPRSTIPPGDFTCQIVVVGISPAGNLLRGTRVRVVGIVEADVRATPSRLSFGLVTGAAAVGRVVLSSRRGTPFVVKGIASPYEVALSKGAKGCRHEFLVTVRPGMESTSPVVVYIATDDAEVRELQVPVDVEFGHVR